MTSLHQGSGSARGIALIGMGPSAVGAPFDDSEWVCWGMAKDREHWHQCGALFEMHDPRMLFDQPYQRPRDYLELLSEVDVPLYMQEHDERIPMSRPYPFEDVDDDVFWCLPENERYGTQISYMLALAIHENPMRIGLWGVDLKDSRDHQKPNIAMLCGIAMGRHIEIVKPEQSDLLRFYPETGAMIDGQPVSYPIRYGYPG